MIFIIIIIVCYYFIASSQFVVLYLSSSHTCLRPDFSLSSPLPPLTFSWITCQFISSFQPFPFSRVLALSLFFFSSLGNLPVWLQTSWPDLSRSLSTFSRLLLWIDLRPDRPCRHRHTTASQLLLNRRPRKCLTTFVSHLQQFFLFRFILPSWAWVISLSTVTLRSSS